MTYFPVSQFKNNQGATRLVPENQMTENLKKFVSGKVVESITLKDLIQYSRSSNVIIKMDIEVSSHRQMKNQTKLF